MINNQPYIISNEYNLTELLGHLDSEYVLDTIKDRLENRKYTTSIDEPNVVQAFEENFKLMKEQFPGDGSNINLVRERVYKEIIDILCNFYNLQFNEDDDTIDLYTAAYYLYDFLVSKYKSIMVNFFTTFIINNKDSLYTQLGLDNYRKNKDSDTLYNKKVYTDQKYIIISANIEKVINYIESLDITLANIIQSTYIDEKIVMFFDNMVADRGNFFKNYYCSIISRLDLMPIFITDIRLQLQVLVGTVSQDNIENYINKEKQ